MFKFIYGIFFDAKEKVDKTEITPLSFMVSIMIFITIIVALFKGDMVLIRLVKDMVVWAITNVMIQ